MNKGTIVYQSDKNKVTTIVLVGAIATICIVIVVSIIYYNLQRKYYDLLSTVLLGVAVFVGGLLSINTRLYQKFVIYSNGITKPVMPIFQLLKKEKFVSFDEISSYSISPKRMCCSIYLKSGEKIDYSSKSIPQRSIETLIRDLIQHNKPPI